MAHDSGHGVPFSLAGRTRAGAVRHLVVRLDGDGAVDDEVYRRFGSGWRSLVVKAPNGAVVGGIRLGADGRGLWFVQRSLLPMGVGR